MTQFEKDIQFAEEKRQKLKEFYSIKSLDGRFVFINKQSGELGKELQNKAIDTILQLTDNKEVYIEEKIVRWKGRKYTAFTLETMSCTVEGREKEGWMKHGEFDYLLYGFEQENKSLEIYIIPFHKLKSWFWENYQKYPRSITKQINHTETVIVPIEEIKRHVGYKKFYL